MPRSLSHLALAIACGGVVSIAVPAQSEEVDPDTSKCAIGALKLRSSLEEILLKTAMRTCRKGDYDDAAEWGATRLTRVFQRADTKLGKLFIAGRCDPDIEINPGPPDPFEAWEVKNALENRLGGTPFAFCNGLLDFP